MRKYDLATLTEAHCCERHFCFQHLHTTIDNCTFKIATKKSDSSSHKEVGCLSMYECVCLYQKLSQTMGQIAFQRILALSTL